ncbi:HD domain-containing phosphohydrolase [Moritella dasanensis]|uniref:HD domain-containing phosphohydrolase n=1 Tax=Moritella dasanensis TaxID=428031 RepID=UPI000301D773|nr:HD domain-containing phosphohydrolase [Moritella dasanensis]
MINRLNKLNFVIIFVLFLIGAMVMFFINSTSDDKPLTTEFEVAEEISLISAALVYNMDYRQLDVIMNVMINNRKDIMNVTIIDDVSKGVVFSYSLNGKTKTTAFNGLSTGYMKRHLLPIVYDGQLIGSVSVELKPKLLSSNNRYHQNTSFIIVFFLLVLIFLNLMFYALLKLSVSSSRKVQFGSKKFIYVIMSCMSVFIAMTVFGGYFIIEKNRSIIESRVELYLNKNIADFNRDMQKTKGILESIYNQMTETVEFQGVYQALLDKNQSNNAVSDRQANDDLLNIINRFRHFGISYDLSFIIMNVDGDIVARQGNSIAADDITKTINSAFIAALSGHAEFLPPKKADNNPASQYYADLYFSYPIKDAAGNVSGVFFSEIPKLPFIYADMSQYDFATSGELIATNSDGYIVSKCRYPQDSMMNCGYMQSAITSVHYSDQNENYLELFDDYRGQESYVLTSWHDELNVILVSKMCSSEVLDSFYEFQKGIILILVVMSTFTIFSTIYTLLLGKNANDKLIKSNHGIIKRLGHAAEFKDNETAMHIVRMSYYSKIIATNHGCEPVWVELLFNAAPMHDIGKIGVPDHILQKPGRLTPDEWVIMRQHPEFGARIIGSQDNELLRMAHDIAIAHHEKWDGTGYPYGIQGEDIPISARIIAIADVFDALTSDRAYKKAWTQEDAVTLICSESGKHFQPSLVNTFITSLAEISDIKAKYTDKNKEMSCRIVK